MLALFWENNPHVWQSKHAVTIQSSKAIASEAGK